MMIMLSAGWVDGVSVDEARIDGGRAFTAAAKEMTLKSKKLIEGLS